MSALPLRCCPSRTATPRPHPAPGIRVVRQVHWIVRAIGVTFLLAGARPALAQAPWTLTLFVDPFPSPYESDWETNANNSTLTVVNPTGSDQEVLLAYQVVNTQGAVLASGQSDPLNIPSAPATVLTSIIDIPGASYKDPGIDDQVSRTGRIPEGMYRACVTMADANNLVLGEDCQDFTIVYPDPPQLLAPSQGDVLTTEAPIFQWTPVVTPASYQVRYQLQIAEQHSDETAEEALNATIPVFQSDLDVTNLQYPIDAQPFEPGKRYVWRVIATDETGFPPAANGGLSEIGSFTYDDGTGATGGARTVVTLSLDNAFDQEPVSTMDASSSSSNPVDINRLCALWSNPPDAISISSASPFGLKRFAGQPSVLFRDESAGRWWIATQNPGGRRSVLVGGDCQGTKTRTRWIASRDDSLLAKINHLVTAVPAGVPVGPLSVDSIPFHMVVLALGKDEVEAPDSFPEGQAFLQGHTLDVAPGLNLYSVLSLQDWGLWWLFQDMGFGEKEIEVKGFLGWDASWNIGGAVGDKAGVDVSTERKFLEISAALPKRTPKGLLKNLIKSTQLSLQIEVGDSIGRGFKLAERKKEPGYSFDVVGKLVHTIQVNDALSFVGSFGLDVARESEKPIGRDVLSRWDWLRGKRAQVAKAVSGSGRMRSWIASYLTPGGLEEPEVNADVLVEYAAEGQLQSLWRGDTTAVRIDGLAIDAKIRPPEKKITLALSGSLAIGSQEELIKAGISREFTWGKASAPPDTVALKKQVDELTNTLETTTVSGELPDCYLKANKDQSICKTLLELVDAEKKLDKVRNPPTRWRARLSAGHMSLSELFSLIRGWGQ